MTKALQALSFSLAFWATLAAVYLLLSPERSRLSHLLLSGGFLTLAALLGFLGWRMEGKLGLIYQRALHVLGGATLRQILIWPPLLIGWGLLLTYAPLLSQTLFPFWLLLSLHLVALLGVANPPAFKPLSKLYLGVGVGLIGALLLLEIGLRLVPLSEDSPVGAQMALLDALVVDSEIGHAYRPNSAFIWTNAHQEFSVDVQINGLGLRDEPRSYQRATPDVKRVLVLGDSFTEALQVELAETPTQIAETCLNEHYSAPIEVINGGLSANGLAQRYLYYKAYGRDFEAEAVIMALYPSNDLWDNRGGLGALASLRGIHYFDLDQNGAIQPYYSPPRGDLIDYFSDTWGAKSFGVLRAIRFTAERRQQPRNISLDYALFDPNFPANLPREWAIHQDLLRRLAESVRADGSDFGLLLIPNWRMVEPNRAENLPPDIDPASLDYEVLHEAILSDAQAAQIPALDLMSRARQHYAQNETEALYWAQDGHFNALGYQMMGEALCELVISEGWLD